MGEGDARFKKKIGIGSIPRGDNNLIVRIQSRNLNQKFLISITTNHLANFNQTMHKEFFGEGDWIQVCLNDGSRPFPKGNNYEIAEIE